MGTRNVRLFLAVVGALPPHPRNAAAHIFFSAMLDWCTPHRTGCAVQARLNVIHSALG